VARPGEVAKFDNAGRERILDGQTGKGFIKFQQPGVWVANWQIGKLDSFPRATVLLALLATGCVDQNPSHCFGRRSEEVAAVVELLIPNEPHVRLVDKGRGLKGVTGLFLCHAGGGKLPQLFVNEREQRGSRVFVTGRRRVEKVGYIKHVSESNQVRNQDLNIFPKNLLDCP